MPHKSVHERFAEEADAYHSSLNPEITVFARALALACSACDFKSSLNCYAMDIQFCNENAYTPEEVQANATQGTEEYTSELAADVASMSEQWGTEVASVPTYCGGSLNAQQGCQASLLVVDSGFYTPQHR